MFQNVCVAGGRRLQTVSIVARPRSSDRMRIVAPRARLQAADGGAALPPACRRSSDKTPTIAPRAGTLVLVGLWSETCARYRRHPRSALLRFYCYIINSLIDLCTAYFNKQNECREICKSRREHQWAQQSHEPGRRHRQLRLNTRKALSVNTI